MPLRRRPKLQDSTLLLSQSTLNAKNNNNNNNSYDDCSDERSSHTSSIHCIKLTPTKPAITPGSEPKFNPLLSEMAEPAYVAAQHGEHYAYNGDASMTGTWDQNQWEQWQRQWQSWYAQQNSINQTHFDNQHSNSHNQHYPQESVHVQNGGWVSSTSTISSNTNSNVDYNFTQSQNYYSPEQHSNLSNRQSISSSVSSLTAPYSINTNNTNYSHSNSNTSLVCEHRNAAVTQPYEAIYHYTCPDCERSGFYDTSGRVYSEDELPKEVPRTKHQTNLVQNGNTDTPEEMFESASKVTTATQFHVLESKDTFISETLNQKNGILSNNQNTIESNDLKVESRSAWPDHWGYTGTHQGNGYTYQDNWSSWGGDADWGTDQNYERELQNEKRIEPSDRSTFVVNGNYEDNSLVQRQNQVVENGADYEQKLAKTSETNLTLSNNVSEIPRSSNVENYENDFSNDVENGLENKTEAEAENQEADENSVSSGISNDCNVLTEPISDQTETNPGHLEKPDLRIENVSERTYDEETVHNEMDVFDHINSDFQAAANIYSSDFATEVYPTGDENGNDLAENTWNSYDANEATIKRTESNNYPNDDSSSQWHNETAFGGSEGTAPLSKLKNDGTSLVGLKNSESKASNVADSNWSHDNRGNNFYQSKDRSYGYGGTVSSTGNGAELNDEKIPADTFADRNALVDAHGWSMDFDYDNEFESDFIVPDVTTEDIKDIEQQLNEQETTCDDKSDVETMEGGSLQQGQNEDSINGDRISNEPTDGWEDQGTEVSNTQEKELFAENDYSTANWSWNYAHQKHEVENGGSASESNVIEQAALELESQLGINKSDQDARNFSRSSIDQLVAVVSTEVSEHPDVDSIPNIRESDLTSAEQFDREASEIVAQPSVEVEKHEPIEQGSAQVSEMTELKSSEAYVIDNEGMMDHNVISMYSECISQMKTVSQVYTERYYQWQAAQYNQVAQITDQPTHSELNSVDTSERTDAFNEGIKATSENVEVINDLDNGNETMLESKNLEEQTDHQNIMPQNDSAENEVEKQDLKESTEAQHHAVSQVSLECLNDSAAVSGAMSSQSEGINSYEVNPNDGDFTQWNNSEFDNVSVVRGNETQNLVVSRNSDPEEINKIESFNQQYYYQRNAAAIDNDAITSNFEQSIENYGNPNHYSTNFNEATSLPTKVVNTDPSKDAELNKEVKFSDIVDKTIESSVEISDLQLRNNDVSGHTSDVTFSSLPNELSNMHIVANERSKTQKSFAVLNSIADPGIESESQTTEEKTVEIASAQWDNQQWYENQNTWSESRQVPALGETSTEPSKVGDSDEVATSYSTGLDQGQVSEYWNDWSNSGGQNWSYPNSQDEATYWSGSVAHQNERYNVDAQELKNNYLPETENFAVERTDVQSKQLELNERSDDMHGKRAFDHFEVTGPFDKQELKPVSYLEPSLKNGHELVVFESNENVDITPRGGNSWDMSSDWESNFDADISNSVQVAYEKSSSEVEASTPKEGFHAEDFGQSRDKTEVPQTNVQVATMPQIPDYSSMTYQTPKEDFHTEDFGHSRDETGAPKTNAQDAAMPQIPEESLLTYPSVDVRNADVPIASVVDCWSGWNGWDANVMNYNQVTNQWEHTNNWDHSYYNPAGHAERVDGEKDSQAVESTTHLQFGQDNLEAPTEVQPSFANVPPESAYIHEPKEKHTMNVEVESGYTIPEMDPKTFHSHAAENEPSQDFNSYTNSYHNENVGISGLDNKREWNWSENFSDSETPPNKGKSNWENNTVNKEELPLHELGENQFDEPVENVDQKLQQTRNETCKELDLVEARRNITNDVETSIPLAGSLEAFNGVEAEMTVPGQQFSGWDSWEDGWDIDEEPNMNEESNTAIEVTPLAEPFENGQPIKSADCDYDLQSSPLQATPGVNQDVDLESERTQEANQFDFTPPLSSVHHLKHLQSETTLSDSANSVSHELGAPRPIDVKNLKVSPSFALRKSCSRLPVSKLVLGDENRSEKTTLLIDENINEDVEISQNEPPRKTSLPVIDGRKSLSSSDEKQTEIVKPTQRKNDIASFEILPDKEKKIVKSHVPKLDDSLDDISCVSTSSRHSKQKLPVSREIFGTPNDSNDTIEIHGIEPEESNRLLEVENVSHSETQCKQSEKYNEGNIVTTTSAGSNDVLPEHGIIATSSYPLEPVRKQQPLLATETFGYTFQQPKANVPNSYSRNFQNNSNELSRNSSFTGSESNAANYTQQNQYQQPQHNASFPGVYPTSFTPDASFHPRPAPPVLHPFMTPPPANLGAPLSVHVPPPMSPMAPGVPFQPNPMMMNHHMQMYYQWQLQSMYNSYIQNYMNYSQMVNRNKGTSPKRVTTRFASVSEMTSGSGNDTDNDEVSELNDNDAVNNVNEEEIAENRQTPELYSRMHSVAKFSTNGRFAFTDSIAAERSQLFYTSRIIPVPKAIREFPGPFNRDRSMKSDVKFYLSERLNDAKNENLKDLAILIKYLILLVESNGAVSGSAVAKILLGDDSVNEIEDDEDLDDFDILESFEPTNENGKTLINSCDAMLTDDDRTNMVKFAMLGEETKLLQYTSEHNLWGFALRFSAFAQVSSTQRTIVELFDQKCIPGITNPLQTFISFKERRTISPEFLRDCWKNWEQHVAIMLSNQTSDHDYNQHCFMILGNALESIGLNIAAQMCFILAGLQFSLPWEADSRLLLLGTNATSISAAMNDFDSIFLSLCFEFAVHLRHQAQDVCFPSLQHFKFLLAKQYVEFGLNTKAFEFCKDISREVLRNPDLFRARLIVDVIDLSHGLKYSIDDVASRSFEFISELETLMMPVELQEPERLPSISEVQGSKLDLTGQPIKAGSLPDSQQLDDQYLFNSQNYRFDQSIGYPSNASDRLSKSSTLERPLDVYDSNIPSGDFETSVPVSEKLAPVEIDTVTGAKEHLGSEPGSPNVFADSTADLRYLQMASTDEAHFYSAPRMANSALNVDKSAVAFEMPSSTANMIDTRSTFDPSLTEADYRKKYQDSHQTPKFKMQPFSISGSSNSVNSIGSPYRKRDNLFRESIGSEASEILSGVFDGSGNRSRQNSMHNYDKVQRSHERPMSVSSDRSTFSLKYNTIIPESDEPNADDRATPTNDMNKMQSTDPTPKAAASSNSAAVRKQSWLFTGVKNVLGKLMPLPNQMHLPEDKTSDFYWDPETKKWVDKTKDGKEEELPPPPPMAEMVQPTETQTMPVKDTSKPESPEIYPSGGPAISGNALVASNPVTSSAMPPVSAPGNPFARGRGLAKSKYVDILANSKQVSQGSPGLNQPPPTIPTFMPGPFPPMPFAGEAPPFPMPDPEDDPVESSGQRVPPSIPPVATSS